MLKILVPVTYGELGGSQVFLLKLIDAMAADSPVHFSCWLFRKGPLEEEMRKRNIPCRIMPFSPKNPFFLLFMIRELRKEHPDVIYLHASRFIALAARLAHVPCVERINMSRNMAVRGWCSFPWLDRLFTSFNTKALAVSDAIRRQLLARGIPDSRICIIRNFVEPDRFRPPPAAPTKNKPTPTKQNPAAPRFGRAAAAFPVSVWQGEVRGGSQRDTVILGRRSVIPLTGSCLPS